MNCYLRLLSTFVVVMMTAQLGVPATLFVQDPVDGDGRDPVRENGGSTEHKKLSDDDPSVTLDEAESRGRSRGRAMFAESDAVHAPGYAATVYRPPEAF